LKAKIYIEGRDSERQSLSKPLPTKLVISGAIVDSIKFIGISGLCRNQPGKVNFKEWHNSARLCIKQASNSIDIPGPYADMEDAFCRTLILNDLHDQPNRSKLDLMPIKAVVHTHDESMAAIVGDGFFNFAALRSTAAYTYTVKMLMCHEARRFGVTEGGYFALVPACVAQGDVVAMFCEVPILMILRDVRRDGERLEAKLVGDAYVHGLMDGQLKERQDALDICEIVLV
jgi:hypothetical protein